MRSCLLLSLLSLLLFACSDGDAPEAKGRETAEAPDFTIELEGAPAGNVLLIGQYMDQQYRIDSAMAGPDGKVRFQREVPYEPGYYFAFFPGQTAVPLLLDQDQTFTLSGQQESFVESMQVNGSLDNRLLYESLGYESTVTPPLAAMNKLLQDLRPGQPEYERLTEERDRLLADMHAFHSARYAEYPNTFFTAFQRASQNPPLEDLRTADGRRDKQAQVAAYRRDFWNGVDFTDERLLRTPAVANKLRRYMTELTPQQADSVRATADDLLQRVMDHPEYFRFFTNYITRHYQPGSPALMDPEAVYVHMIRNYFTRERAFWTDSMTIYGLQDQADMMARSLVGEPGPNLSVNDRNGTAREIYAETKPYVVVYIYNPECEHCIEETPKLMDWYRQNREWAAVYALALDTEEAKWKAFVERFGLQEWTNVFDPSNQAVFKTYFVDHTPEIYLLNADRTIIAKNLQPAELDEAMARASRAGR